MSRLMILFLTTTGCFVDIAFSDSPFAERIGVACAMTAGSGISLFLHWLFGPAGER